MRKEVLSLLIIFAICDQIVSEEEGFFTVVGSHLFQLGKSYRVSIDYQGYKNEKILEIGVKNRKRNEQDDSVSDNEKWTVAKNVTLSGSGVQSIDLDVSELIIFF